MKKIKIGDTIRIIRMSGEEDRYNGRVGVVLHIDDFGMLHGTWGGCAIILEEDEIEVLND